MGGVSAAQRPTRPGGAAGSPLPAAMGVGPPAIGGSMGAPTIGAVSSAMGGMSLERPSSGGGWRAANSPGAAAPSAITGTTSAFAATSIGAGAGGEMGAFVRDRAASMRGGDALETFDAAAAAAPAASAPGSRAREVQAEMLQQGMAPVYDPSTAAAGGMAGGQEADGAEVGAASAGTRERKRPPAANLDLSDIRHFLLQPGPMDGPVQCTIRRMRTDKGSKSHPSYSLYLEPQGGAGGRTEFTFLLSGRKRKKKGGANYMISLDEDDQARDSGNYFGKVRGNFLGTQFVCYDKGANPKKADESLNVSQFGARQELGVVNYQHNVLGMRGPRKMTVAIPSVDQAGRRAIFKPDTKGKGSLVEAMERNDENNMILMTNKVRSQARAAARVEACACVARAPAPACAMRCDPDPTPLRARRSLAQAPKWNEKENAWCLNFNGRVSKASVKNFQLVSDADQEHIIVQFGKTGEDTFTMDYQWPCSALQAFAICLTSFDSKLACE